MGKDENIAEKLVKGKTMHDIEEFLKSNFKLTLYEEYHPKFANKQHFFRVNILNSLNNSFHGFEYEDLKVVIYEIDYDVNSKIYYEGLPNYIPNQPDVNNKLFVLLEYNSRSISSNSSVLQRELVLELGITAFELENRLYHMHLSYLADDL